MANKTGKLMRIDPDLAKDIEEMAQQNQISLRRASLEIKKVWDESKLSKKKNKSFLEDVQF